MKHYLNQYYKKLFERAEERHRDDMEAWQWAHESEINANALNMGIKQYTAHTRQPIAEDVRKAQEQEMKRSVASCALYDKNRREHDDGEFETQTIHINQ